MTKGNRMNFLALDVETANSDYSSICQIGIVEFADGRIIDKWNMYINPEACFDPINISIHGITERDVSNAPTFDSVYAELKEKITGQITVHHMPFDKIAISRACNEYELEILQTKWLDSAKIARRAWKEFASRGYGLANIARFLNIEFAHHDALEDAAAAGQIVHHACEKTGLSIEGWLKRVEQPIKMKTKRLKN
jgi:DNA polymerase-3 subunit epsilon